MKYYHGTNYSAAMSIIQNGFKESDTIWNCSYPDRTYLYPVNYDGFDETTNDPLESPAFQTAIESGQIAAATVNDLCPVVVVFELDIPDDAEIYEDTSYENATDTYEMENCELNAGIKDGSIKGRVYAVDNGYNPNFRPFYLASLYTDQSYYNQPNDELLKLACNAINSASDNKGIVCLMETLIYDCVTKKRLITELQPDIKK